MVTSYIALEEVIGAGFAKVAFGAEADDKAKRLQRCMLQARTDLATCSALSPEYPIHPSRAQPDGRGAGAGEIHGHPYLQP